MQLGFHSIDFRTRFAFVALLISGIFPLAGAYGQVMTNFPPSGDIPPIDLRFTRLENSRIRLQWDTVRWAWYGLLCKTNLADEPWPLLEWIEAQSDTTSTEMEAPIGSFCFYRVQADPRDVWNAMWARYHVNLVSYDAGDYYWVSRHDADGNVVAYDKEVHIRRIFRLVHVGFNTSVGTNFVTASGYTLHPVTVRMGPAMELWRIDEDPVKVDGETVAVGRTATLERVLADLRADDRTAFAFPAYTAERLGNPFVADTQLMLRLKDGVSISELSDFLTQLGVQPGGRMGPGPPDWPNDFSAALKSPKSQDPFVISRNLAGDSRVLFAEPNMLGDLSLDNWLWDYLTK